MKPTAVIFDLDGTLLDTLTDIAEASNRSLAELHLPTHPTAEYRTLVGDGVYVLFRRALPREMSDDEPLVRRCVAAFHRHYDQLWSATSRPYEGIEPMLQTLLERHLSLAVLSNKPHAFTVSCVRHFFPHVPFARVLGHRDGAPRKPDPAGVEEILQRVSVSPKNCLYVGDTNTDMETARNSGCIPVGVTWGFRSAEELEASGAVHLIDYPRELLMLVETV